VFDPHLPTPVRAPCAHAPSKCSVLKMFPPSNKNEYNSCQCDGKDDDRKDHCQDQQETTHLSSCLLLISIGRPQLHVGLSCIRCRVLDIHFDSVEHRPLFMYNVCHIPEELVQFPNALFDVPDFRLPFDYQRLLEVYLILRR